jgi:hypothetical protein
VIEQYTNNWYDFRATFFRMRAGIPSGPVAFDVSKLDKQADTSSTVSSISEISISNLLGEEGKLGTALGEVKTEQKHALKSSAFSAGVLAVIPLLVIIETTPER